MARNGTLTKWLVVTGTAVVLGLSTWAGAAIVDHTSRLATQEAQHQGVIDRLDRIEDKVDRLLLRRDQ